MHVAYAVVSIYTCALVCLRRSAITPSHARWWWGFYASVLSFFLFLHVLQQQHRLNGTDYVRVGANKCRITCKSIRAHLENKQGVWYRTMKDYTD